MEQSLDTRAKESVSTAARTQPLKMRIAFEILSDGGVAGYWNDLERMMALSVPEDLRTDALVKSMLIELLPNKEQGGGHRLQAWMLFYDTVPVGLLTTMIYDDSMQGRRNLVIFSWCMPNALEFETLTMMQGKVMDWARKMQCTHMEAKTQNGRLCAIMKLMGFNMAWRVGELKL